MPLLRQRIVIYAVTVMMRVYAADAAARYAVVTFTLPRRHALITISASAPLFSPRAIYHCRHYYYRCRLHRFTTAVARLSPRRCAFYADAGCGVATVFTPLSFTPTTPRVTLVAECHDADYADMTEAPFAVIELPAMSATTGAIRRCLTRRPRHRVGHA